ncbi:MAG: thermonuclease family protein [Chloroflexi bacterium]|nr:thermonuclease family protein [Chloroflexota bacterium]
MTLARAVLVIALAALGGTAGAEEALPARVVKVTDGDTVDVALADDTYHVCRLIGIDAREQGYGRQHGTDRGQPLGRAANDYLAYLVRGPVRVTLHGKDVYDRSLCWLDGARGAINAEMVRAGFAEVYRGPGDNPYREQLEAAEREAREAARGIWRLLDYQSPREFRQQSRDRRAH